MKTKHSLAAKIPSLLLLSLTLAAGAAGAQTLTQTYGNAGVVDGSLSAIEFNSYQVAEVSGYDYTSGVIGVMGGSALGYNWVALNYEFDAPDAPAGYELTGINLSTFIISLGPPAATTTFDIYAGLDRTGGVIGTFSLTEPTSVGSFADITIPLSALAGGFSIGYATNSTTQPGFTTYSESLADANFHPSVTFTYTESIPEPSVALLGGLGLLSLLRRRRA